MILTTDNQLKSRMMGDYQVRFCERLGVKFPLPTWLKRQGTCRNLAMTRKKIILFLSLT